MYGVPYTYSAGTHRRSRLTAAACYEHLYMHLDSLKRAEYGKTPIVKVPRCGPGGCAENILSQSPQDDEAGVGVTDS